MPNSVINHIWWCQDSVGMLLLFNQLSFFLSCLHFSSSICTNLGPTSMEASASSVNSSLSYDTWRDNHGSSWIWNNCDHFSLSGKHKTKLSFRVACTEKVQPSRLLRFNQSPPSVFYIWNNLTQNIFPLFLIAIHCPQPSQWKSQYLVFVQF